MNRNRIIRAWITLLVVVVMGVASWFAYKPVMSSVQNWRVQRALKAAQASAEAEGWEECHNQAMIVYQLDPGNHTALRLILDSAIQTQKSQSLRIASALFRHPDSTLSDKTRSLELFLLLRDLPGFLRLYETFTEEDEAHPEVQLQKFRYIAYRGEKESALRLLRAHLGTEGEEDRRFPLLLADLLLQGQMKPEYLAEAHVVISRLMKQPDGLSLQGFRLFGRLPYTVLSNRFQPIPAEWLQDVEGVTAADRLIAASFDLARVQDEGAKKTVISQMVSALQESDPEALGAWLLRVGAPDQVLLLVDEDAGKSSGAFYQQRLQALLMRRQFAQAEEWLEEPHPSVPPMQLEATRALLAGRKGNSAEAENYWKRAFRAAELSGRDSSYVELGGIAMRARELEWASRCFLAAARSPRMILPTSEAILPAIDHLVREGQLEEAMELNSRLLVREPEHPLLQNNFAYLHLLMGKEEPVVLRTAESLVKRFPKETGFRSTLALALLQADRNEEALAAIEDPEVDWSVAGDSSQAVRVQVLQANGKASEAAVLKRTIDPKELYPAERKLFRL